MFFVKFGILRITGFFFYVMPILRIHAIISVMWKISSRVICIYFQSLYFHQSPKICLTLFSYLES